MDVIVARDIVAVVPERRRIEGKQPDRGYAEVLQIVELARQAAEIADAVVIRVEKRLDVQLVNDGVLEPDGVAAVEGHGTRFVRHRGEFRRSGGLQCEAPGRA